QFQLLFVEVEFEPEPFNEIIQLDIEVVAHLIVVGRQMEFIAIGADFQTVIAQLPERKVVVLFEKPSLGGYLGQVQVYTKLQNLRQIAEANLQATLTLGGKDTGQF